MNILRHNARRLIFLFLFVVEISPGNCSFAKIDSSSTILSRFGNEIGKYERTYFGLFPTIANFVRAEISTFGDGNTRITIEHEVQSVIRDTVITLDKIDVYLLKDYVEHFENISMNVAESDREALTIKYSRLIGKGIMELRFVSLNYPTEIIVTRMDRLRCEGVLLYADHQCVVLVKEQNMFAWNSPGAFAVIPVSEIRSIAYPRRGNFGHGFGTGFLIGFVFQSVLFSSSPFNAHNSGEEYMPWYFNVLLSSICGVCTGVIGGLIGCLGSEMTPVIIAGLGINYDPHLEVLTKFCFYQNEIPPEIRNKINSELRR